MTPEEVDAIIDSADENRCRLCATLIGSASNSVICPDCTDHIAEHETGFDEEPVAEKVLILLGLTKGCRVFGFANFSDEVVGTDLELTSREVKFLKLVGQLREHSLTRRTLLWDRYCAIYIRHTVDVLVASQEDGRLGSLNCFMWVLNELRARPLWSRFLLSDDPRASSGNRLALAVAQQMILHVPVWERQTEMVPDPPMVFRFMGNACMVLGHVLCMQVDKPAAVALPAPLHDELRAVTSRWLKKWPDNKSLLEGLQTLFCMLSPRDSTYYETSRFMRDTTEGLQTCARDGCTKSENLYQCSRCQVVLYCSRKHQADDWKADPVPHRQICYRPCY